MRQSSSTGWWGKSFTINHSKQCGLLLPCQKDKGKSICGLDVSAKRGANFKGETVKYFTLNFKVRGEFGVLEGVHLLRLESKTYCLDD
jgi:hypothetical protein